MKKILLRKRKGKWISVSASVIAAVSMIGKEVVQVAAQEENGTIWQESTLNDESENDEIISQDQLSEVALNEEVTSTTEVVDEVSEEETSTESAIITETTLSTETTEEVISTTEVVDEVSEEEADTESATTIEATLSTETTEEATSTTEVVDEVSEEETSTESATTTETTLSTETPEEVTSTLEVVDEVSEEETDAESATTTETTLSTETTEEVTSNPEVVDEVSEEETDTESATTTETTLSTETTEEVTSTLEVVDEVSEEETDTESATTTETTLSTETTEEVTSTTEVVNEVSEEETDTESATTIETTEDTNSIDTDNSSDITDLSNAITTNDVSETQDTFSEEENIIERAISEKLVRENHVTPRHGVSLFQQNTTPTLRKANVREQVKNMNRYQVEQVLQPIQQAIDSVAVVSATNTNEQRQRRNQSLFDFTQSAENTNRQETLVDTTVGSNVLQPTYEIQSGDTLWSISRKHNVSLEDLREWNQLSGNLIFAYEYLHVQNPYGELTTNVVDTSQEQQLYTVRRGDYLTSIARQNGVTVAQLQEWNNLQGEEVLPIGTQLVISDTEQTTQQESLSETTALSGSIEALINWFKEREGTTTYSMINRNGPYSYDCSSAVFSALIAAGYLPEGTALGNTESLYALEGSLLIPIDESEVQAGDIFVSGYKGASSGASGHTGVAVSNTEIIHMNYASNGIATTPIQGWTASAGNPTYWYRLISLDATVEV